MKRILAVGIVGLALLGLVSCSTPGKSDDNSSIQSEIVSSTDKNSHSSQVQYILTDMEYPDEINVSYEYGWDLGIFHMLGTRVYVYVSEKEKYFSDAVNNDINEKVMIAAVKYFIFAAEGENELCAEMSQSEPLDISKLSDSDILNKRPKYMHAPVKLSDTVFEIELEYNLTTDSDDISPDEMNSIIIEVTVDNEVAYISNIT